MSEKAPLQNQFSECERVGWPSVEKQGRQRRLRICSDERVLTTVKIGIGEFRVIARPTLRYNRNDRAQCLAALNSG